MTTRALTLAMLLCVCALASARERFPYQSCFEVASRMHEVPLDLVLAVAATESNWDPDARSHADAHGIMQIQWPGTARHLGVRRVAELYNPCLNISLGAKYLAELTAEFVDTDRALAAYNYGPGRIRSAEKIPLGAQKYAATVARHRNRIRTGMVPKALKASSRRTLVAFDSKIRAQRVARALADDMEGATVSVVRRGRLVGGYAVVLAVGKAGLTARDHVTLGNMGFAP